MQLLPRPRAGTGAGPGTGADAGPVDEAAPAATARDGSGRSRRGSRVRSRVTGRRRDEAAALPAPLLSAPSPLDSIGLYGADAGGSLLDRDAGLWASPSGDGPGRPPNTPSNTAPKVFDPPVQPPFQPPSQDETPFDEATFAALAAAVRSPGALLTDDRDQLDDELDGQEPVDERADRADGWADGWDDSWDDDTGAHSVAGTDDGTDDGAGGRDDELPGSVDVETAEWQPEDDLDDMDDIQIDLSDNPRLITRPSVPPQREQPGSRRDSREPGRLEDLFPTSPPNSPNSPNSPKPASDAAADPRADPAAERPLLEQLPAEMLGRPGGPTVPGVVSRGGQPAFVPATPSTVRRSRTGSNAGSLPASGALPGSGALADALPSMRRTQQSERFPVPEHRPAGRATAVDELIALPRLPEPLMAAVLTVVALIGSAAVNAPSSSWVPIAGIASVAPLTLLAPDNRRLRLLRAGLLLTAAAALPCLAHGTAPVAVLIAVCAAATYPMVLADGQARAVLGLAVASLLFPLFADAFVDGPGAVLTSLSPAGGELTASRLVLICGILVVALVGAIAVAVRRALAATAELAVQREQAARDVALRIGHASATDAPSGLPNREALIRATSDALEARTAHDLEPSRDQVGVIMAEIDRFDVIADSLGAALADDIALQVARRLRSGLPAQQFVARIGRHQFGLLLPHATPDSCASVARRITRLMERPILSAGRDYSVTCSVGAALRGPGLRDAGDLLQAADEAARAAANAGTARWVLFDQAVRAEAHSRASLEIELRDAVRTGSIEAFFQPLVALGRRDGDKTGEDRIVGAEALARWIRPDGSSVPPARFIPMADELGLGSRLGLQITDLALDSLVAWRQAGLQIDQVWVNISPAQLRDPDLPHDLAARLATRGLPPSSMVVEVSAANLSESEQTQTSLSMLRSLGIAVALDDFGRSGTSLSALRKLPVSAVKLDHVLAAELGRQDAVPRSIAQLCRSLGLRVIVEGVETMMQLRGAREIDADAVQGFAIARPLPSEDVVSLLGMRLPQPSRQTGRQDTRPAH